MFRSIVTLLFFLFLHLNCFSQNSWTLLTTQEDATIIDAINFTYLRFTDTDNGWACGSKGMAGGTIYKTTDGGITWDEIFITNMFDQFNDLYFCDNNVIWAGGFKNTSKVTLFYKSEDGGTTWNPVTLPEDLGITDIYFADQNKGWIIQRVSGGSRIYSTPDGGTTWNVQMDGTTSDGWTIKELSCFYFFDENNAIAAGNYGYIIYTNDGGTTWNYRDTPVSVNLSGMYFINNNTGWIVGGSAYILKTTDGGETWSSSELDISQNLSDVYFTDENNGWIAGGVSGTNQGIIYSTTDGGATWSQETLASNRDLNCIFFLDNSNGWIAGNYGTVYKTVGTTGTEKDELPVAFRLEQNYPNPFNPSTAIRYGIPSVGTGHALSATNVSLKVFDILGNEVATLVNEQQSPGYYERTWNAENVSSGIYFYKLEAGSFRKIKKMILLK